MGSNAGPSKRLSGLYRDGNLGAAGRCRSEPNILKPDLNFEATPKFYKQTEFARRRGNRRQRLGTSEITAIAVDSRLSRPHNFSRLWCH